MKVLVTGATGFVGSHVRGALVSAGHPVRCTSRNPARAAGTAPEFEWAHMDVEDPQSLGPALEGMDAAVYLVHSMADHAEPGPSEERAANAFLKAAETAGVRRIVFLGGPDPGGAKSAHLAARLRTGEVLRSGSVSTLELRAAMIVGEGSESWTLCRDLALRLPILAVPSAMNARSQPIAIDDVVAAVVHAVSLPLEGSHALDLPGPDVLSARQILEAVAALRGLDPISVRTPLLPMAVMRLGLRVVTRADPRITTQLIEGLRTDLLATGVSFWEHAPELKRTPFIDAARTALGREKPPKRRRARLWEWAYSASTSWPARPCAQVLSSLPSSRPQPAS